jgi:hypothetical protein
MLLLLAAAPAAPRGSPPTGHRLAALTDGLSTAALSAEVMRATAPIPVPFPGRDHNAGVAGATALTFHDGRADPACRSAGGAIGGLHRDGLAFQWGHVGVSLYAHTLPPNWNRPAGGGAQRCDRTRASNGADLPEWAHIAAGSYHAGGVTVCPAGGGVRLAREGVDFAAWQALGSRAGGEVVRDY